MPANASPPRPASSSKSFAKSPDQIGFAVLPRRWVVERFFAWIGRNRRLAKDFEASIDSARAFLYAASVMLLSRRIARHAGATTLSDGAQIKH
jgi:transposase